jgi:type I restriction enzyme R subunit
VERMMGKMVIEQLKNKHHLTLNAEQAKVINGLMVKEYMNEFHGRVA